MSVHSQDSDNEELGAVGGKKPISRQVSPFSRPSSAVFMESLAKTLTEQMQSINSNVNTLKDQSDTTNSTLADLSRSHSELHRSQTELHRSQTDLNARLERIERASPDLNPVELRTNPSDDNFAFHAVPPQLTAPLATRPSITSEVSNEIFPFRRPSRAVEGPQLPRSDCHLSVPRKTRLTSDSVTISSVARSREPGSEPKFPTFGDEDGIISIRKTVESGSRDRDDGYNVDRRTDGRETIIYKEEFIVDENTNRSRDIGRIVVDNMSGIDGTRTRNVPNLNSGVSNSRSFTKCSGVMDSRHSEAERYVEERVAHSCSESGLNTMRSRSTSAFAAKPLLDRATANSRMVENITGLPSVVYPTARIQPSIYDTRLGYMYTDDEYEHERMSSLNSSSVPYTLLSSRADPYRDQCPVRPRQEAGLPPIVSHLQPRSKGVGALLLNDNGKEIHLPFGPDQAYIFDQSRPYVTTTPRKAVSKQTTPMKSCIDNASQPNTRPTSDQPVTNTAIVSMPYVTPDVTSAPITATMINGPKNLDQDYKQKELERGVDKNWTCARMENVQDNAVNVNVVIQNVELGLSQREMALQATGGSPTSDNSPGYIQADTTPEPLPSKPITTQADLSLIELGYMQAYAKQGQVCGNNSDEPKINEDPVLQPRQVKGFSSASTIVKRKVVNKSYLVTDPTTVLRRGLVCSRQYYLGWIWHGKLVGSDKQFIGLQFSIDGCQCVQVKVVMQRLLAPPAENPPSPPPPPKPPPPPPGKEQSSLAETTMTEAGYESELDDPTRQALLLTTDSQPELHSRECQGYSRMNNPTPGANADGTAQKQRNHWASRHKFIRRDRGYRCVGKSVHW